MKKIYLIFALALFFLNHAVAQWTQVTAIPTRDIVSLALLGDTILAATDTNLIYKSSDGGITWDSLTISSNPSRIVKLSVIDNIIYAGTAINGIFTSADSGVTWVNSGAGLLAVSGFVKWGNDVYASTLGTGVFVLNQVSGNWIPFNNSLPTFSVNVFTITSTTTSLLIGAGANGTFYRYDFSNNLWNEEYYDSILHPGLQIEKMVSQSDTIFAVTGNRIIRSDDDGLSWDEDAVDAHNGLSRRIYQGTTNHYVFSNNPSGVWVQERNRQAVKGTTWAVNEVFLPGGVGFDMLEFQNSLFLAKEDGLYVKNLAAGIQQTVIHPSGINIYTDPSKGGFIHVSGNDRVVEITISNMLGQLVYDDNVEESDFIIHPGLTSGPYVITLYLSGGRREVRKILITS